MPHFVDSRINENVEVATEYFKALVSSNQKDAENKQKQSAGSIGFIPYNISFTMDGISGIKIYNELSVDTNFLPAGYSKTTDFIVTGVDHKIQNGDWETSINVTLIPRTSPINNTITSSLSFTSQTEEAQTDTAPANTTSSTPLKRSKTPPDELIQAMKDYDISTPLQRAHFLAQVAHESGEFIYKEEIASGAAYEGRKDLGNTQSGDGKKFKGRGYIQVTGRANYEAYDKYLKSKGITDDVLANPTLVATKYAADASAWWWAVLSPKGVKKFNSKANEGTDESIVTQITKWVNGGTNGLESRKQKFKYYWSEIQKNSNAYT
jgi:predicted chitinase